MKNSVQISKFLSYHLRHRPELLGLELAPGGWVAVDQLLQAANKQNFSFTLAQLEQVVAQNDKQRFSFDSTGTLIRANQGHSVPVDLQLEAKIPPPILYHGTNTQVAALIKQQGIRKMSRHHVHLSSDINTAEKVGARKGKKPILFQVNAFAMSQAGYVFYCSDNQVWLTEYVPFEYLQVLSLS